ncbi:Phytoene dehydrogenase-related protein [Salinihabitans flavidus]|uniref:Pyridine nucleotide-disulfide oxidoreductase domain-containing protein 2 n=1 Tax=Salinihabitans flavidus TaxID=569882 RepID=A0A1H8TLR7_9RHOB|nr:NAD(P)/FAD-dependent oxidoreductase [Salinihabitans flavidus]SEO91533.1 Phytoene dehydrogenase-related protein [Salinihabitans flavidus]
MSEPAKVTDTSFDAVLIGGGHNALVTAGYLARAGLKVAVVEARSVVGGACVTEEFWPGFRNSSCSYLVGLLAPEVIRDLELTRHGLRILERDGGVMSALPDGEALELTADPHATRRSIERFSLEDANEFEHLSADLDVISDTVRRLVRVIPPEIDAGLSGVPATLRTARALRGLPRRLRPLLSELMLNSLGGFLDARFESDAFKGLFGVKGLVGNMVSTQMSGSAYVLLHHVFGEVNGKRGKWGQPVGGMGAITQAMRNYLESRGGAVLTGCAVKEVLVAKGRAGGVMLSDGTHLDARLVVSGVTPKILFERLLDPNWVPDEVARRIRGWRCRSGTFRMNVAISELPDFVARPGTELQRHHSGTVYVAPSLEYLDAAHDDARHRGYARKPIVSVMIPTALDDTLAPTGTHIASLFCQHFNNDLPEGESWDTLREPAAERVIDTVNEVAPNFRRSIIGYKALSPLDLERDYGLTGGDIFHGEMHLDQLFSMRPGPGMAGHRTPVKGLYQCASGTHPGGGVTGLPGMNAARVILNDLRWRRVG